MKVLQVIDTLNVGGAERVLVHLANLLHASHNEVTVMILVDDGALINELHPDIPIVRLHRTRRFNIQKMKAFAEIIDAYDIVHAHLKHNFRYTKLVAGCYRKTKAKLVFHDHSHNLLSNKFSVKYYKDVLFKSILKPDYYIGVSHENCTWGNKYLGIKASHCFLLENTVEKITVAQNIADKSGVVMVSNITPIKNIEFALDIIKETKEPLTIYGRIIDESYYQKLINIIEEKKIPNITFITNCTDIQQELLNYKYGLHTSLKETGPLVLIEFLAQELPFVAFASGQVFNTIGNEIPEFFNDTFNQTDWINKIKALSLMPSNKIKKVYADNFSSEIYLKKCLTIYQHIINS